MRQLSDFGQTPTKSLPSVTTDVAEKSSILDWDQDTATSAADWLAGAGGTPLLSPVSLPAAGVWVTSSALNVCVPLCTFKKSTVSCMIGHVELWELGQPYRMGHAMRRCRVATGSRQSRELVASAFCD